MCGTFVNCANLLSVCNSIQGYNDTALMWAARNNHAPTFLHLLAHPSTEATIVNKVHCFCCHGIALHKL